MSGVGLVTMIMMLWSTWKHSPRTAGGWRYYVHCTRKHFYDRKILTASGAEWVAPVHANNRGSHNKYDVAELFSGSSREDIIGIINRFYMDFRICGYDETIRQLEQLL